MGSRLASAVRNCRCCASTSPASAQAIDWQKVDDAFGRKAAVVAGDAHRYGFPRTDLNVTLDGVTIKPALALGGWVAFKPIHGDTMVMGDLVVLEDEINPVMTKLIENGIEITALHNHLLRANPATFYLHVGGMGDPVKLATAIHTALAQSKTPLGAPAASTPSAIELDTVQLDQIIGVKGQANGGVYLVLLALSVGLLMFGRGRNGDGLSIFRRSPWVVGQLSAMAILYSFAAGLMGAATNLNWLH
jgi:hypothetical protein